MRLTTPEDFINPASKSDEIIKLIEEEFSMVTHFITSRGYIINIKGEYSDSDKDKVAIAYMSEGWSEVRHKLLYPGYTEFTFLF